MAFLLRALIKGLLLFALINLLMAGLSETHLGRVSGYNSVFPGRARLPFGETPREAYNFSLFDLDAMFASHELHGAKDGESLRILIIGDSSVWGTLLQPEETLAGQLNRLDLMTRDGRPIRFYNLGYPTLSLTKDLLLLDRALAYRPDGVIWMVTLDAFPRVSQLSVPLVANNPRAVGRLLARHDLPGADGLKETEFWQRTLVGQRKNAADIIRLQLYGVLWAATGIDQAYPLDYPLAQVDLAADRSFMGRETLAREELAFDVLRAGRRALGEIPLLVVNEPILISRGENSDIRYNFYYPRWAYDQYRQWLPEAADEAGFAYLDSWDLVPPEAFTNSAIHIDRAGTTLLAESVVRFIHPTFDR
jgi:hypothetical protein